MYDILRPLPPHIHDFLRISKLVLTFASVIMASISVLIICLTPSFSKEYAKLLIMLIFFAAFFDFYSQLIFDAQYIMPWLCVYRDAPIIKIPLNPMWGFIIWVTLIALNSPLYVACFIHRHQLIVDSDSWCKMRPYIRRSLLIAIALPSLSYGYSYYIAWDANDRWIQNLFSSEWDPSIPARMECMFQYAEIRNIWGIFIFLCSFTIVAVFSLHTFLLLRQARTLSAKAKSYHRIMLISLIGVASVPVSLIILPFSAAMIYYLLLDDIGIPVMDIASLIIASHSLVHSLVLILTTPSFRKRLFKANVVSEFEVANSNIAHIRKFLRNSVV